MKILSFVILNTTTFFLTLTLNYLAATGKLTGKTVGDVSDRYLTLFTPPDFAFSIWGLIYFLLTLFVAFQWYCYVSGKFQDIILKIGIFFSLSNIANALWLFLWVHEEILYSVMVIVALLVAIIIIVLKLNMERWDAPVRLIVFVWWPLCFYLGWMILATVANIASMLVFFRWTGGSVSPVTWVIVCIILACIIYLILIYNRNMREAALVGIWGVSSIVYRHWNHYPSIAYSGLAIVLILFIAVSLHGYKNRNYSPFEKWKRNEV